MTNPEPSKEEVRQNFLKMLQIAAEKRDTEQKLNPSEENTQTAKNDLNILPLPDDQIVEDDRIIWVWNVKEEKAAVHGVLYRKTVGKNRSGDYEVNLFFVGENSKFVLIGDDSKDIGQALVSAWNYQKIWKEHAGHFMEKQLFDVKSQEPDHTSATEAPQGIE